MNKATNNLQDVFLNQARKNRVVRSCRISFGGRLERQSVRLHRPNARLPPARSAEFQGAMLLPANEQGQILFESKTTTQKKIS